MSTRSSAELTDLLSAWERGDGGAFSELVESVYEELHRIAARELQRGGPGQTLQATALVHEAYLKLAGQRRAHWHNRLQFFAVSARIMRRILMDRARERKSQKRGGDLQSLALGSSAEPAIEQPVELVELDEALARLEEVNLGLRQVVDLHYFAGFTHAEIAGLLGVSVPTVVRRWRAARAWLRGELGGGEPQWPQHDRQMGIRHEHRPLAPGL